MFLAALTETDATTRTRPARPATPLGDSPPNKNMFDKIKPILITAVIAIVAVGLFSRFAPTSVKKLVNG